VNALLRWEHRNPPTPSPSALPTATSICCHQQQRAARHSTYGQSCATPPALHDYVCMSCSWAQHSLGRLCRCLHSTLARQNGVCHVLVWISAPYEPPLRCLTIRGAVACSMSTAVGHEHSSPQSASDGLEQHPAHAHTTQGPSSCERRPHACAAAAPGLLVCLLENLVMFYAGR
jgi:hypothetical protein